MITECHECGAEIEYGLDDIDLSIQCPACGESYIVCHEVNQTVSHEEIHNFYLVKDN